MVHIHLSGSGAAARGMRPATRRATMQVKAAALAILVSANWVWGWCHLSSGRYQPLTCLKTFQDDGHDIDDGY